MTSDAGAANPPKFDHVGVIVRDISKTIQALSPLGIEVAMEPFDYGMGKGILFAGDPFKLRIAVVKLWSFTLELLQPVDQNSLFAKFLKTSGEGTHHIAYTTSKWDTIVLSMEKLGSKKLVGGRDEIKKVQGKTMAVPSPTGMRWCYLDTKQGGIITELIETA